jgi:hypothetical protein
MEETGLYKLPAVADFVCENAFVMAGMLMDIIENAH